MYPISKVVLWVTRFYIERHWLELKNVKCKNRLRFHSISMEVYLSKRRPIYVFKVLIFTKEEGVEEEDLPPRVYRVHRHPLSRWGVDSEP